MGHYPDQINLFFRSRVVLLEYFIGCMKNNFQEGDSHCEEHPDVNHLDVGSGRHTLGQSKKSTKKLLCKIGMNIGLTYMVDRAKMMVTLT